MHHIIWLEYQVIEGDNPVIMMYPFKNSGVELFGNATQSGWWTPSKAKYVQETDSEQVPWGKDEKNFEKRVK